MEPLALVVDLGTGGPKVGLATLRGRVLWWEHHPVQTSYGPGGAATQDAARWWELVVASTRRGLAATAAQAGQVVAVCCTGQWASTVPVDARGLPVDACVMWMDTRGARHSREAVGGRVQGYRPRALATWLRRSGGLPSTWGDDPLGHMLHLDRDRPDLADRVRWYLEPVDYLSMRFTGVAAASQMSMTAAWLTDNRYPERVEYDDALVALAGVDRRRLPPLVPAGTVIAPVRPEVATELGISPEARVVTGLPDLHGAAVGSGCLREHEAHVSIGTTSWVSCPVRTKKTDLLHQMATVPGIGPVPYLLGNNQESAGRCLEWFRDSVAAGPGGAAPTCQDVTGLAGTAAPGSGGVLFAPWLKGERSPVDDRAARAGFHNLSLATGRAELARAVLEGVAHNIHWLLRAADRFTGSRLEPLRVVGGGARSDLWCQILADVCAREVERVEEPFLAGLRGAALACGLAVGALDTGELRAAVPVDRTFAPDPRVREVYARASEELPRLYRSQRRMFARLNGG